MFIHIYSAEWRYVKSVAKNNLVKTDGAVYQFRLLIEIFLQASYSILWTRDVRQVLDAYASFLHL